MTHSTIPHYDVILIGAGSVGTPAALSLAQSGCKPLCSITPQRRTESNKRHRQDPPPSRPGQNPAVPAFDQSFRPGRAKLRGRYRVVQGRYCFVAYRDEEERTLKQLLTVQKGYGSISGG